MSTSITGLSADHYTELSSGSAINDGIITERGYQTVRADQLPPEFHGESPLRIDDSFTRKPKSENSSSTSAEDWILEKLDGQPVSAAEMVDAAKAEGISDTTLRRAKTKLKIESKRSDTGWLWYPPNATVA